MAPAEQREQEERVQEELTKARLAIREKAEMEEALQKWKARVVLGGNNIRLADQTYAIFAESSIHSVVILFFLPVFSVFFYLDSFSCCSYSPRSTFIALEQSRCGCSVLCHLPFIISFE